MSKISFHSYDEETGRSNSAELPEDLTWHEVAEEFFSFLQGCGYFLTREDFADYWAQYLDHAETEEDGCCGGCDSASCTSSNTMFTNNTMNYSYSIDPSTLSGGTITIKSTT